MMLIVLAGQWDFRSACCPEPKALTTMSGHDQCPFLTPNLGVALIITHFFPGMIQADSCNVYYALSLNYERWEKYGVIAKHPSRETPNPSRPRRFEI